MQTDPGFDPSGSRRPAAQELPKRRHQTIDIRGVIVQMARDAEVTPPVPIDHGDFDLKTVP